MGMQEPSNSRCLSIAAVTILVHLLLLVLFSNSPVDSPSSRSVQETAGGAISGDERRLHTGVYNSNLDLSSFSPLHTISSDGKQEKAIFTSMLWNITNAAGDSLNIPTDAAIRYQLLVDVGLETGSGLMCLLQEPGHTSKVLLGLESHPLNFGLSSHNMLKGNPSMQNAKKRIQLLPFALADVDKYVKFNENFAPACGSILPSATKAWWCALTSNVLYVPALSMNTLLKLVPSNYDFHFLKVDVEGAEELVLKGGSEYISRFRMVSLEMNKNEGKPNRINEATNENVDAFMKRSGFQHKICEKVKSFDCHFAKTAEELAEAKKLHNLAIYSPRRGEKMSEKKCREIYMESYLNIQS